MKENEITWVAVIPVGIGFLTVCFLLWLTKGSNAKLIKAKLKLGALLLTFSWFANSCDSRPFVTCYEPLPAENSIWIDSHGDSLTFKVNDTIFIQITNPTYNFFSFDILNENEVSIESGILQKSNDSTNYRNVYGLVINEKFDIGKYKINFFGEPDSVITQKNKISFYNFWVKE